MPTRFTPAQIEHLKLQAKFTSRRMGITHTLALDQLAQSQGFSNWSLLMKCATQTEQHEPPANYFRFARSVEEMRVAMRTIPHKKGTAREIEDQARTLVKDIWEEFGSARNVVDFAVAYVSAALQVPRFKVSGGSTAYWEMRLWLPYAAGEVNNGKQILLNRLYKPVGLYANEHVRYEDYDKHQVKLTKDQLKAIAHSDDADGYLYGLSPWSSRKHAELYLTRLTALQGIMNQ